MSAVDTPGLEQIGSEPEKERFIDSDMFYSHYFGHPPNLLRQLVAQKPRQAPTIYLVGDSTLDNKYWIPNRSELHPNAYIRSKISGDNPVLCRDVSYWLSTVYPSNRYTVINCAIEQTLLRSRVSSKSISSSKRRTKTDDMPMHFEQDTIVRDHITNNDILVVSVGGNDVALAPTCATALAVLGSVLISPSIGMSVLRRLFKDGLQRYIEQLICKQRPRLVVICMLYYPDQNPKAQSWANVVLRMLQYNSKPHKLQRAIRTVFEKAVSQIAIPDTNICFAPFFDRLDGADSSDYVARVEPSEAGGRKMAELLQRVIDDVVGGANKF